MSLVYLVKMNQQNLKRNNYEQRFIYVNERAGSSNG